MQTAATHNSLLPIRLVLICTGLIATLALGFRHGFGFWLQPIVSHYQWSRESFSLAMALQNLVWGLTQPFFGAWADKVGAKRILILGMLLYIVALLGMSLANTPFWFAIFVGVVGGCALSATTWSVLFGIVGRAAPVHLRTKALGIVGAAGSFGQFLMIPVEQSLISVLGWQAALWVLVVMCVLMWPAIEKLSPWQKAPQSQTNKSQSSVSALKQALKQPRFWGLMAGYFVCGFQVIFIAVHMPAYLKDQGIAPFVAVMALALIGLFNIGGSFMAGFLGQTRNKAVLLAGIYSLRAVAIVIFLWVPLSAVSVAIFAITLGFLWLSTVPLTNAIIAQWYGVEHFGMLVGLVFLAHQIGSFLGVWLGGYWFDTTGSYQVVWYSAAILGVIAGVINWSIRRSCGATQQG